MLLNMSMKKLKTFLGIWVLVAGIALSSCSSGRIPCPDVSGKKGFSLLGMFKKNEPAAADQANEGRDLGGRDMDYDKKGLLKKKNPKMPTKKRKGSFLGITI
jgi:hypothetical protein